MTRHEKLKKMREMAECFGEEIGVLSKLSELCYSVRLTHDPENRAFAGGDETEWEFSVQTEETQHGAFVGYGKTPTEAICTCLIGCSEETLCCMCGKEYDDKKRCGCRGNNIGYTGPDEVLLGPRKVMILPDHGWNQK